MVETTSDLVRGAAFHTKAQLDSQLHQLQREAALLLSPNDIHKVLTTSPTQRDRFVGCYEMWLRKHFGWHAIPELLTKSMYHSIFAQNTAPPSKQSIASRSLPHISVHLESSKSPSWKPWKRIPSWAMLGWRPSEWSAPHFPSRSVPWCKRSAMHEEPLQDLPESKAPWSPILALLWRQPHRHHAPIPYPSIIFAPGPWRRPPTKSHLRSFSTMTTLNCDFWQGKNQERIYTFPQAQYPSHNTCCPSILWDLPLYLQYLLVPSAEWPAANASPPDQLGWKPL